MFWLFSQIKSVFCYQFIQTHLPASSYISLTGRKSRTASILSQFNELIWRIDRNITKYTYEVFTTADATTMIFGLCTPKWGIFVLVIRRPPTFPLTRILHNVVFSSPKIRVSKAGPSVIIWYILHKNNISGSYIKTSNCK